MFPVPLTAIYHPSLCRLQKGRPLSILINSYEPTPAKKIGYAHGSGAKDRVAGSIAFYTHLFSEKCNLDWPAVTREAERYIPFLETTCPRYLDEMHGLAAGAGVAPLDIVALNVRTEIMFGLFTDHPQQDDVPSDGCTSLGWLDAGSRTSLLAQNWDWQKGQAPNLLVCHVTPSQNDNKTHTPPAFSMVTEAGIIGKIGLNAHGVGCCLNAIRARGVDRARLPVHLALRTVLESPSRAAAIARLRAVGVAGSAHILVADATGATGLECVPSGSGGSGVRALEAGDGRVVLHTNHLLLAHPGVDEPAWLPDSHARLARIRALTAAAAATGGGGGGVDVGRLWAVLRDEDGYPCAINREQKGESTFATLFTIVMDLTHKRAQVKFGRPTEGGEQVTLSF